MKNKKRKLVRRHTTRKFGFRPYHNGSYRVSHPYPFWNATYALDCNQCITILKRFKDGYTIERIAKRVSRSRRCISSYICSCYNVITVWDARKIEEKISNKHRSIKEKC